MNQLKIEKVKTEETGQLAELAERIWREHYTSIIGEAQVEYMLQKFQSEQAVLSQMKNGTRYYFLRQNGQEAGYMGVEAKDGALFLSKLYVAREFRGLGISRAALSFLQELCRKESLSHIWLTVNRHNNGSILAYRALGFTKIREQETDIGNGFAMDDYVMQQCVADSAAE